MKKKVLIVSASYYGDITASLIADAEVKLDEYKIKHNAIDVPGVFEIPVTIAKNIKKYDGFIALGCVIKGETPHFDFISKTTFDGLMNLSLESKKPIGNGIITSLNLEQAIQRSGQDEFVLAKNKNKGKGKEAAKAVISVLSQNNENSI
jgi:6,7-dimethyl-8-ribityllumazine synthase